MIFPFFRGFVWPQLAPITYFLFAVNLFVFAGTYEAYESADAGIDKILDDATFIETQGSAFAVLIKNEPKSFSSLFVRLAEKTLNGNSDSRRLLGGLAMRNSHFMNVAAAYDFGGDEIQVTKWKGKLAELTALQSRHPSYQWGMSQENRAWAQWITYQFSHSGALHLFWNMIFLLIFGALIETRLGGSFVIVTYLGGGIAGAFVYCKLTGLTASPLVGASAAVTGLIGLTCFAWLGRERLRFFYWLLPIKDYYGFVFLPSWVVLIVSILPDVSGALASPQDFGSIAYTAHLGGAVFGAFIAWALALGWLQLEVEAPKRLIS